MTFRHDLEVNQGASWTFAHTHRDGAGVAIDLTGYSARMMVKASYADGYQASLSTEAPSDGGTITLGGASGVITLAMTAAQTHLIASDVQILLLEEILQTADPVLIYRYDLEVIASNGAVTRVLQGQFILHRAVTR